METVDELTLELNNKAIINDEEIDSNKRKIIELFYKNIKDKQYIYEESINKSHDGKEGHWLEKQMDIKLNNNNTPDLFGYEMKKQSLKISYGDWSATEYFV